MNIAISMLSALFLKLATQQMLEYLFILSAKAIAKSTKNEYDDEFVKKAEEILNK